MTKPDNSSFTPPTAEQIGERLQQCAPQQASRFWSIAPLVVLGVVAGFTFTSSGILAALMPFVIVIGLMFAMGWRVRSLRRLEQRAVRVPELAMMRYDVQALRLGWRLLPQLRTLHELHGRTVAVMAMCLDQVGAYEAAIVAYDDLILRLPSDHPTTLQLVIQRTIVQLMCDDLTDADDALRRLRGMVEPFASTPIGASYHLAGLLQQVQTHHFADALDHAENLVEQLRPLGIDAGYGYALMALSHYKTNGPDADTWWSHATMLLPPATLIARFSQLGAIRDLTPATMPQTIGKS